MDPITNYASGAQDTAATEPILGNGQGTNNMFIKLLVAQIQNQNPLEPKDPSEFVQQLNQLTQTESMQKMVSQSSATASVLESLQVIGLGGQVGSELSIRTEQVQLANTPVEGSFELSTSSGSARIELTASNGEKHLVDLGPQSAGSVNFTLDPVALGLPPGTYRIAVNAGEGIKAPVDIHGTLSSVRLSPVGGVVLQVENLGDVPSSSVTGFLGHKQYQNG